MSKLNRSQAIAVFAGLAVITYLFFSGSLISLFTPQVANSNNQAPTTGVRVENVVVGSGQAAASGDRLTVHYVGMLDSGRIFDSSYDRNTPIDFVLGAGNVIRGWDEGLKGMRVGGKRILTIAPDFGYGAQGFGAIPPDAVIIFEVELLDVQKP